MYPGAHYTKMGEFVKGNRQWLTVKFPSLFSVQNHTNKALHNRVILYCFIIGCNMEAPYSLTYIPAESTCKILHIWTVNETPETSGGSK